MTQDNRLIERKYATTTRTPLKHESDSHGFYSDLKEQQHSIWRADSKALER